ncbi:MAG TPA: S-methyl-5'-thioadenosine phosphorylase [Nocardioides sp.]|nr:S-methyl-5'-thioadenosine phosphorylase [Nocardioides sp.]
MTHPSEQVAEVAVIGGSGFYSFLGDPVEHVVETPYGSPSAAIAVGEVAGRRVAFLPRHGKAHQFPPHAIPYRANLWALASLGVRQVLAPSAVGGLRPDVAPRDLVVPDQLVDRTWRRVPSFVEQGALHVPFGDPYCARLGSALARDDVKAGGTLVVIEGPRFSTRAESRSYAAQGWSLIGMTGAPEAMLARELRLCYQTIALVTDMDAGASSGEGVSQAEVFAVFEANLERVKQVLVDALADLPDPDGCECAGWADGLDLTYHPDHPSRAGQ